MFQQLEFGLILVSLNKPHLAGARNYTATAP